VSIIYDRLIHCDSEDCSFNSESAGRELVESHLITSKEWLDKDEKTALGSAEFVTINGAHYCPSCAEKLI